MCSSDLFLPSAPSCRIFPEPGREPILSGAVSPRARGASARRTLPLNGLDDMTPLVRLIAASALLTTSVSAQSSGSRIPMQELSAAFSSRALSAQAHTPVATGLHFMQGTAALNASAKVAHVSGKTAAGAAVQAKPSTLAAFSPASQSALTSSAGAASHAPRAAASPLTGAGVSSLSSSSAKAAHAPAAKAKP